MTAKLHVQIPSSTTSHVSGLSLCEITAHEKVQKIESSTTPAGFDLLPSVDARAGEKPDGICIFKKQRNSEKNAFVDHDDPTDSASARSRILQSIQILTICPISIQSNRAYTTKPGRIHGSDRVLCFTSGKGQAVQNSRFFSVSLEKTWATFPLKEKWTVSPIS